MYEWAELIKLWEHEQVTATQVIGQLLKHGEAQHARIAALERRLDQPQPPPPRPETPPPTGGKPSPRRRSVTVEINLLSLTSSVP